MTAPRAYTGELARQDFPRIRLAVKLLAEGHHPNEVARRLIKIARQSGHMNFSRIQAGRAVRAAMHQIQESLDEDRESLRARVLAAFWDLYRDPKASVREKTAVLERLSVLMGLNNQAPEQHQARAIQVVLPDWQNSLKEARARGLLPQAGTVQKPLDAEFLPAPEEVPVENNGVKANANGGHSNGSVAP